MIENNQQNLVLEVKNLKTYFDTASGVVHAVDGVSFSLSSGQTMGIVGESGSGKSVTGNSIIRLLPPKTGKIAAGEILYKGQDIVKMSHEEVLRLRGQDISAIFQDPMTSLDPVFTIGDQMVEMICEHNDMSKVQAWKLAVDALKQVGMPEAEKRMSSYPYQLSGGMCQRVIIAMAVCVQPQIVIADEPTTALDVTVQAQVLDLLRKMQKQNNTAILLITHDLGVIWEMCDTVMVMYAGRTVEFCSVGDLYANAMHPYTWGLLDSIPKLSEEHKADLSTIKGNPPDLRLTGDSCNFYNRCPYAQAICQEAQPPLVELSHGHLVACHRQNAIQHLQKGQVD